MNSGFLNLECPLCHRSVDTLALNYVANHDLFRDAPGEWYVDCPMCWDDRKETEREPDYHVSAVDFMTAKAVTKLDEHLSEKFWYTETVQARMRDTVRAILSPDERASLDRRLWPIPFGRDVDIEMDARLRDEYESSGVRPVTQSYSIVELMDEHDQINKRIAGIDTASFDRHANRLRQLWGSAPPWLKVQLQKIDDRGIEAILRVFIGKDDGEVTERA